MVEIPWSSSFLIKERKNEKIRVSKDNHRNEIRVIGVKSALRGEQNTGTDIISK